MYEIILALSLLIGVVIGFLIANDAKKRGYSRGYQIGLFIGGLLLSVIVLVFWLEKRNRPKNAYNVSLKGLAVVFAMILLAGLVGLWIMTLSI